MLRSIYDKIRNLIGYTMLSNQMDEKDNELIVLSQTIIDLQKQLKYMQEKKIHVVFVCHRPQLWDSLKTVCDACISDKEFEVTIVTIPNKKQLPQKGLNHEHYESEGAEEFFEGYPCNVIQGYDYNTGEWIDLRDLHADYLFFQTPYDVCRPAAYHAKEMIKYTNLCWVHYGYTLSRGYIFESCTPNYYMKYVKNIFVEYKEAIEPYKMQVTGSPIKTQQNLISLGYPRLDNLDEKMLRQNNGWKHDRNEGRHRILWLPRWSTDEGNCCFFDYKDKMMDYIENSEDYELLFRPHPQAFTNFIATGEMSEAEVKAYLEKIKNSKNAAIDQEADYWKAFASCDVVVADITSLLGEFFVTGKPIIYCQKAEDKFSYLGEIIYKGSYVVTNWEELCAALIRLGNGEDPLKEMRERLIEEAYEIPEKSAGYEIKEYLKRQFQGK